MPPLHDIAHLAHVEVLTDKPEECLDFYVRYLGMTENGSAGDSVFLRAWDDYENTPATAPSTSSPTRTATRWASTTRPSGSSRRARSSRR
jgi:catechol 2,3-dioxygenase